MPEYLSPGVYVEEVDTGNKPIEGVATSTVGFLGVAERGPREPMLVTSFTEYARLYGRYNKPSVLAYAVEGFFLNGGKRCFIARVASKTAVAAKKASANLTVSAIGPGTWANNRVAFKISACGQEDPNQPATQQMFRLTVMFWDARVNLPQPIVDPTDITKLTDPNRREPTIIEQYDNLSTDPLSTSFCERQINGASAIVTVALAGNNRPGNTNALQLLAGGTDGAALDLTDFKGDPTALPGTTTGLLAFQEIDEIAILCCPDEYYPGPTSGKIAGDLVAQCELLKDRFVILQASNAAVPVQNIFPSQATKYAAYYYPWINITDPVTDQALQIPPGGHVAGIYARSDTERG
ncbi:MAG TPA: hypothetical protein VKB52_09750, partial [Rhodanobacteraceae bacterium]|nr:hypothetical protein [Rhodanobacteraceae bacterium]